MAATRRSLWPHTAQQADGLRLMTESSPIVLTALLVLAVPSPGLAGQSAPDLLLRAAAKYEQLDGMCASFQQRLEVPLLETEVPSSGRLCSKQPAFFRMDFVEPDGDAIVADGEHLWVYFPSSQPGQVLRSPLGEGAQVDFTREFLSDPGVKYEATEEGTDLVSGRGTTRFALDPKTGGLGYTLAKVWIDTELALIRRVEIHQDNGSIRHVTLNNIDLAPGMTASEFQFTQPSGVQVVSIGEDARDG